MQLGWRPILSLHESVQSTVAWYQRYYSGSRFDGYDFTLREIESYTKLACSTNAPWAVSDIGEESGSFELIKDPCAGNE